MYQGFPIELLSLLRCPRDAGFLRLTGASASETHVRDGSLECVECGGQVAIVGGMAQMLDPSTLESVSDHEHRRRDEGAAKDNLAWENSAWSQMEVLPTLEAMEPIRGTLVLELGCGKGRFTTILAGMSATVLAIDFSLAVLKRLARRIEPHWRIGLVQADCTKLAVARNRYDRVLSTLVSNLPTIAHREALNRVVADALAPGGRYVFTAHHYDLRERFRNTPQAGHYPESGIFRYLFRRDEMLEECKKSFERARCRPIQVELPYVGRFGLRSVAVSRMAERLPVFNQFGGLLLGTAERPITR